MTLNDFRRDTKNMPGNSEIVYFELGCEDETGEVLLPGIGIFDIDSKELVYLGDITVLGEDED